VTGIALTKLDVLDGFETLKICTGYDARRGALDYLPTAADAQARCHAGLREMPGWSASTVGARSWADLPAEAIKYVRRIEELIRCPVALLSTSPERDDTILVTDPFATDLTPTLALCDRTPLSDRRIIDENAASRPMLSSVAMRTRRISCTRLNSG
jgi:hypothetical protein